jgi:hypothetical protein
LIFYTHKLQQIVSLAGLGYDFKRGLQENKDLAEHWAVVQDWYDASRRDPGTPRRQAVDCYSSCTGADGILPGIGKRW